MTTDSISRPLGRRFFVRFLGPICCIALVLTTFLRPGLAATIVVDEMPFQTTVQDKCEFALTDVAADNERGSPPTEGWKPCTGSSLSFGLISDVAWVRFHVKNAAPGPRTVYLEQPLPWIERHYVWVGDTDSPPRHVAGKWLEFENRPVFSSNFYFPLELPAGATQLVTLRAENLGSLSIGLTLHGQEHVEQRRGFHNLYVGFVLGGTLLLLLYNLVLFLLLRDSSYLLYAAYSLANVNFCGALYGYTFEFLWPNSPEFNFRMANASPAVASALALLFTRQFFGLPKIAPRLDKVILALFGVHVAGIGLQFANVLPDHASVTNTLAATTTVFLVLGIAIVSYWQRLVGSSYFLVAWGFSLGAYVTIALFAVGVLPFSYLIYYAAGVGVLLEMALLSYALAGRIRQLSLERDRARIDVLETERRLSDSLARVNDELERSVRARTAELEEARRVAEVHARTDVLTGMSNRRAFFEFAVQTHAQAGRTARPYVVMMADLDHFKQINDQYGHQVGDDVLKHAALAIQRSVRDADITGRVGGEEFAVLLPESDADRAMALASRINDAVASVNIPAFESERNITVSIGLAECAEHDDSFDDVLERADSALYEAKRAGRNRIVVAGGRTPGHAV